VVEAHQQSVAKHLREALGKARDQKWLMKVKTAGRCFCHCWTVSASLLGAPVTLQNLLCPSFHRAPRARARSLDAGPGEFHSMLLWCLHCSRSTRVATCPFESLRPFCAVRATAARERAFSLVSVPLHAAKQRRSVPAVPAQERPGARDTRQASRRSLGITARGVERKTQSTSLGS